MPCLEHPPTVTDALDTLSREVTRKAERQAWVKDRAKVLAPSSLRVVYHVDEALSGAPLAVAR